jgi:putative peptide zinc metalloprotease protein
MLRPIIVDPGAQAKLRRTTLDDESLFNGRPARTAGLVFLGALQNRGKSDAPWLIRIADDRCIRASKLLYHVLVFADGRTPLDKIAERVRDSTGDDVTPGDIAWLIEHRLAPSGLLASTSPATASQDSGRIIAADPRFLSFGSGPPQRDGISEEASVLASSFRRPLLSYRLTAPITALLQHLFWPPVMTFFLIVALGVNVSVVLNPRLLPAVGKVLVRPDLILALLGIELAAVLLHELGHATALARARCRFGTIGIALYLIWPVLYTDVTHVYRLDRTQRIRVDLGGVYFQLFSMIGMYAIYLATGADVLLLAIFFMSAAILQQFTPFLRLDGYYTVADTLGVDEPLALVGPFVRDRLPWNRGEPKRLPPFRRAVQFAFVGYLLAVVAFLVYPFAVGAYAGPTFGTEFARSGQFYWSQFVAAVNGGDPTSIISSYLQLILWALIPLGVALFIGRILLQFANVVQRLVMHGFRLVLREASMAGVGV